MAKVRATTKGYVGGVLREMGEVFEWPEGNKMGKWVEPVRFGGKGDHDGDGRDGGAAPAVGTSEQPRVVIPADWQNLNAAEMKALANQISADKVPNKAEAERVISEYVEVNKPEAFGDAPAPQTVQSGLADAGAAPAPDWVAPGVDGSGNQTQPVPADDE